MTRMQNRVIAGFLVLVVLLIHAAVRADDPFITAMVFFAMAYSGYCLSLYIGLTSDLETFLRDIEKSHIRLDADR